MATFDFKNLEVKTDKDKAIPVIEHTYLPLKDFPDVVVTCDYFKAGEKVKYMTFNDNGKMSLDITKIFRDKVKSIAGLTVKLKGGKELAITDADTLLAFPDSGVFSAIVLATSTHIATADDLTEDEVKN